MMIYVAHAYGGNQENYDKAKNAVHDLQVNDLENCYICPVVAFSHMGYGEIGYKQEIELCLDLLTVCDKVIVVGQVSQGVRKEIDMARRLHMEVSHIDE